MNRRDASSEVHTAAGRLEPPPASGAVEGFLGALLLYRARSVLASAVPVALRPAAVWNSFTAEAVVLP